MTTCGKTCIVKNLGIEEILLTYSRERELIVGDEENSSFSGCIFRNIRKKRGTEDKSKCYFQAVEVELKMVKYFHLSVI